MMLSRCELNSTQDNDTALLLSTEECNTVFSLAFESSVQKYSSAYCAAAKSAYFQCSPDVLVSEIDDRCCYSDFCILGRGSTIIHSNMHHK